MVEREVFDDRYVPIAEGDVEGRAAVKEAREASKLGRGLDPAKREALRRRATDAIPSWYSPWAHVLVPAVVGAAGIVVALVMIRDLRWWELLVVPATFLASNAFEWWAHKHILHRRRPGLTVLYDRHTPVHHMLFLTDDMAVRARKEWRLVLIPAFGVVMVVVVNAVIVGGLMLLGHRNIAALYGVTSVAYVLSYEWLHLAYHLPADHPIGKLRVVAALRRHHAIHHAPQLMQRWNFNVTFPIWDLVRGTTWKGDRIPDDR